MLGLIFSYVKSALVFCIMTVLCIAAAVLGAVFAPQPMTIVLRVVAVAVVFVLSWMSAYILAARSLESEIEQIGNQQCNVGQLSARLNKVRHRCIITLVRAPVRLSYAQTLIYRGLYKEAEIIIADTLKLSMPRAAYPFAHRLLACLTFARPDSDRFRPYYKSAVAGLKTELEQKNISIQQSAQVTARLFALNAMYASMIENDSTKALDAVEKALNLPALAPLHALSLRALGVEVARRADVPVNDAYVAYLRDNGNHAGFDTYFRFGADTAENGRVLIEFDAAFDKIDTTQTKQPEQMSEPLDAEND